MTSQSPDIRIPPETPVRAPSSVPVDDAVLPFEVASLDLRGRLTRLGPALDGGNLEDAAHEYFLRSEQIPTRVRLAVGEEWRGGDGSGPKHRWRAGGMLLQFLPKAPERARQADLHPGDAPDGAVTHEVAEDDAWVEGQSLIGTVEDVELIDPDLSGERLLYRLFHERGVRVFQPLPLRAQCSCSRDAVSAMLKSFAAKDRAEMVKDGKVVVTCEFCSSVYQFTPHEAGVEE